MIRYIAISSAGDGDIPNEWQPSQINRGIISSIISGNYFIKLWALLRIDCGIKIYSKTNARAYKSSQQRIKMRVLKLIWLCFFGPRLKRNFYEGAGLEVRIIICLW